jgi:hypothetical protein
MDYKSKEQKMKLSEQLKFEKQRIEKSAIAPKSKKLKEDAQPKKRGPKPNPNAIKYVPFGVRLKENIVNHVRVLSIKYNQSQRTILESALATYFEDIGEQMP